MCRVTAFVLVLGVTLAATATAFVAPGGAIKRKIGSNNPTFRLYMAADKVKTKDAPSKTSASSKSAPTPFFAKKEPKTADKKSSETTSDFNPFQLAAEVNGNVNINGQAELQLEEDKQELGIWAARAILLLVAAIWGTSFAVRYRIVRVNLAWNVIVSLSASHLISFTFLFLNDYMNFNTTECQVPWRSLLSSAVQPSTIGGSLCSVRCRRVGQFALAFQAE